MQGKQPLPDSGDHDPSFEDLFGQSTDEEDVVKPLFKPGEGMEEPAAMPTTAAEPEGAKTGLPSAPSPTPSHGFETPTCTPPGAGYYVPDSLKKMVLEAQCSISLH